MIHPSTLQTIARDRAADRDRRRHHVPSVARPTRQGRNRARRVVGGTVIAVGQRIVAGVDEHRPTSVPQPRGAPPGVA